MVFQVQTRKYYIACINRLERNCDLWNNGKRFALGILMIWWNPHNTTPPFDKKSSGFSMIMQVGNAVITRKPGTINGRKNMTKGNFYTEQSLCFRLLSIWLLVLSQLSRKQKWWDDADDHIEIWPKCPGKITQFALQEIPKKHTSG